MKFTDRTRRVLAYRRHAREELGIKTEHMDALVEVQRLGAPDSGSNA